MASNATAAHLWSECVDHQACICQAFDVVWRELHVAAAQQHLEVVQHSITQPILQRQSEMNKGCEGRRTEDQEYIDVSSSSSVAAAAVLRAHSAGGVLALVGSMCHMVMLQTMQT